MSITPGGNSHWLPLFHVDHAAEFISALAKESNPVSQTYYLLDDKKQSPSMTELVSGIAKELRVSKPWGAISPKWLSKVLGSPLGRKIGIPKESLDFIVNVNQTYPLTAAQDMQRKYGLEHAINSSIMPHTISDLDFRLVHSHPQAEGYIRGKRGPLATLERVGSDRGKPPILFVHGTLSGADCLLPLAEQFPESSVCLADLPGFGRSPYHHGVDVIEGHIESLVQAIRSFETPVTLVGTRWADCSPPTPTLAYRNRSTGCICCSLLCTALRGGTAARESTKPRCACCARLACRSSCWRKAASRT